MKTLYIECKMGAAGDMLMAALYELIDEKAEFLEIMNSMFGDKISINPKLLQSCSIAGTHMQVSVLGSEETPYDHPRHEHYSHHEHHSYQQLLEAIGTLSIPKEVKADATEVYRLIGEAEAKVHHTSLDQIHFHEVGTWDAVADVVGCSLLMHYLKPEQIIASPIHVGNGMVRCAHGILPVPAPATAELLRDIPYYTGDIQTELCTPTGAALLRHFASDYTSMPIMTVRSVGIGLGTKELPAANMVRCFLGHTEDPNSDIILDCSCNLDDITGEKLGYAMEVLLDSGALDVFYTPIQMKKNRPGILLHCFCRPEEKEKFSKLLFFHTTTRGIRYQEFSRAKLNSFFSTLESPYGTVRIKSSKGYGVERSKYEYEDLKAISRKQNISIGQLEDILANAKALSSSHPSEKKL